MMAEGGAGVASSSSSSSSSSVSLVRCGQCRGTLSGIPLPKEEEDVDTSSLLPVSSDGAMPSWVQEKVDEVG